MQIKSPLMTLLFPAFILAGCQSNQDMKTPKTGTDAITDNYFGTIVSDPYRWLENGDSSKVKDWIDAQNNYADKVLSGFSEGKGLAERIKELSITSAAQSSPQLVNGKLFYEQFTPPQAQPVIVYKTWPDGKVEVLFDPNKSGDNVAITGFWPSPQGNYIAYGTAVGGNEATTIHIKNVKDGNDLPEVLPDAGGGTTPPGLIWDADEKGVTYVRFPADGSASDSAVQFYAALYHHPLGADPGIDKIVFGKGLSKVAEYAFIPSEGSKLAAMMVHFGDGNPNFVYFKTENNTWKQVLDTTANVHASGDFSVGVTWDGDDLLVISYENALRGKLLSISPDGNSRVLIPEGDWAMNAVSTVKNGILITKVRGADWKADQYDNNGKFIRTVGLPETGIGIGTIVSSGNSDQALITYNGWTTPETWAQYDVKNGDIKTIYQLKPAADYSEVQVQKTEAVSKDGTKIPLTVLAMKGVTPNGERPTILYAYGGFNVCLKPRFTGPFLAWLEKGGILAYANIRGGGEFGEGWHEAGMLGNKQNVFDDMYAASEALIKNNWTDSGHLGILGGSNGGLLMGAQLTQHSQAFKAVVTRVGIYDMLRNELTPNGQYNISEYGTASKEADFKWLYAYSPYHHVKPNTAYPAVLLVTGVNDPRVAPWQSRKFAAALQSANISDNPILLLTRMNEGHGVTASFSQRMGNTAAALTFFAHELQLSMK